MVGTIWCILHGYNFSSAPYGTQGRGASTIEVHDIRGEIEVCLA